MAHGRTSTIKYPSQQLGCRLRHTRPAVFVTQTQRYRSPCLICSELFLDDGTSFRVLVSIFYALLFHLPRFFLQFTLRVPSVLPSPVRLLLRLGLARVVAINSFAPPESSLRHLKSSFCEMFSRFQAMNNTQVSWGERTPSVRDFTPLQGCPLRSQETS